MPLFNERRGRVRRLTVTLQLLFAAVALGACVRSDELLLTEADFVQPVPDEVTFFTYSSEEGEEVFRLSLEDDGKPTIMQFARDGAGYVLVNGEGGDDGSRLYFAEDGAGGTITALSGPGATFYGFGTFNGPVLMLHFVSADADAALEALRKGADAEGAALLDGVKTAEGSLVLPSREALFYLAERWQAGELELVGGPFYLVEGHVDGRDPATAPPAALDAAGNPVGG
jgi:hypothetical protein